MPRRDVAEDNDPVKDLNDELVADGRMYAGLLRRSEALAGANADEKNGGSCRDCTCAFCDAESDNFGEDRPWCARPSSCLRPSSTGKISGDGELRWLPVLVLFEL